MVQFLRSILKNLEFKVSNTPTSIYKDIQSTIDIIKENYLKCCFENIAVPIHYVYNQYYLLTIDSVKFKTTIQTEYIGTKSSIGPLLERHYAYIYFTRYYPLRNRNYYRRIALDTLRISCCPADPSKNL